MLKNFITTASRNITRNIAYSLINILGLTIGITSSIFLLLYVIDELSYDKYHVNGNNIYRVITNITEVDDEFTWVVAQIPFGPAVKNKYPEVEEYVRFIGTGRTLFKKGELKFYEEQIYATDTAVFDVFTYQFLEGNPKSALNEPRGIVLTRDMAIKYFGRTNVLGESLETESDNYLVTGVIENVPKNSHFSFDALVSVNSLDEQNRTGSWGNFGVFTYLYAPQVDDPSEFEAKLSQVYDEFCAPIFKQYGINFVYKLQRIPEIHLYSRYEGEANANGDIKYVYIFSAIAFFMLIIASINYMNLATARSSTRSREVGIRKVMGSHRILLIGQFITESVILTVFAFVISIILVLAILPYFNNLLDKDITMAWLANPQLILGLLGIIAFVGILGGSYPAFYLSSFNPATVLKGKNTARGGSPFLRKGLVVLQFSISIVMIVCTWLVYDQLQYLRQTDLGFDKEHIIRLTIPSENIRQKYPVLRERLLQEPAVINVATASTSPGYGVGKNLINVEAQNGEMVERGIDLYGIDFDYITTLGMKIVDGRDFSREIPSDSSRAVLVTEAMLKRMGWDSGIGKKFSFIGDTISEPRVVVGVVKDYHHASLYDIIEPLMFYFQENNYVLHIKVDGKDIKSSVAKVEKIWNEVNPDQPFDYTFLDQEFAEQYQNDERRGQIFTIFAFLTMAIACLGLLGLASFTTEQRTKEISIRKVVGASLPGLLYMVSREFVILVAISIVIGLPVSYYFMSKWLQNFAYAMDMSWLTFVLSSVIALLITVLTVSYHTVRAALANPVDALKEE